MIQWYLSVFEEKHLRNFFLKCMYVKFSFSDAIRPVMVLTFIAHIEYAPIQLYNKNIRKNIFFALERAPLNILRKPDYHYLCKKMSGLLALAHRKERKSREPAQLPKSEL